MSPSDLSYMMGLSYGYVRQLHALYLAERYG
jgi:hypothetical protein